MSHFILIKTSFMIEVEVSAKKLRFLKKSNLLIQEIFERKLPDRQASSRDFQKLQRASKSFIFVQFQCHFGCTMSKPEKQRWKEKNKKSWHRKSRRKKKLLKSSAGNVVCEFSELQNRLEFLNLRVQLRTLYVSQSLGPILHLNLIHY